MRSWGWSHHDGLSALIRRDLREFAPKKSQSTTWTEKSYLLNLQNSLHPCWLIFFIPNDTLVTFVPIVTLEDSESILKDSLGDSEQLILQIVYLTMFKIMLWLLSHLKLVNSGLIYKQTLSGKKRTGFF